jgi:hypothetical protein
VLEAIAGYDALDVTCVDWPTEEYSEALNVKTGVRIGGRIGVARQPFFADVDRDIELAFNEAIINWLVKQFNIRKYKILEGFREQ